MALLNLLKWFRANTDLNFRILLRSGGALESEFRALGETHVLNDACGNPAFVRDVSLIFSNTCTNGEFIETLPYGTIPVITHVHEMPSVIESYGPANFRMVQRQTTAFIACSEAVRAGLIRLGVPGHRITTIHESISVERVLANAAEKTRQQIIDWHGWGEYDHIVAGCGVAEWRKGADLFVQMARAAKDKLAGKKKVLFLWVGVVPPDERGHLLLNDVRNLGLEDTVLFLGEQTNPHSYLAAADLFCLTSREDPFPLVMLEAAALGKPIICFKRSGGGEEFCQSGGGVPVPYLDANAMADAVLQLLEESSTRESLGKAAAKRVAEHHDVPVLAPRFLCEIEKHGSKPSGPSIGYAQVYFPTGSGYSEASSKSFRVPEGRWTRLQADIPPETLAIDKPLYLDPIAQPALIEIAGIMFRSASGKILFRYKRENFDQIQITTGVHIPGARALAFVSYDSEPRLAVPIPPHCRTGEVLRIEWWQHISTNAGHLAIACRDLKESLADGSNTPNSLRFIRKFLRT